MTTPRPSSRSSARAAAAVARRDDAHDREPEPEVRRARRSLRAHRHERLEQALGVARRQRRALVRRPSARASSPSRTSAISIAPPVAKSTAFSTSLSSICATISGTPSTTSGSSRRLVRERPLRVGDAVALDAAGDDVAQVEALALGVVERLLEPRRLGHAREDRGEPVEPLLRALDVAAGLRRRRRRRRLSSELRTTASGVRSSCARRAASCSR